ncbi:PH and SEC7 domain-containing protein 1-like [Dendronephthya gigantea]|uniref:PH and SEC7 domain-containing protein 1-like n=1 Tax=Dendronephthya gigantea TaxID=151771 RepID=UPI00106B1362|nr:PH and SEC7 domain-containing protein 1-like [Dendronephthya gigantea]
MRVVSRLPAKKVVEALRRSPDTLKLRLRKDTAAAARARPYLRRFSVQDPKLKQFQTRNAGNIRRSASLPSRSKRPVILTRSDAQSRTPEGTMSKGKTRIVGQETSPTGIDKGTDGVFRRRTSLRSGSFSKIMTSFPAHGGPPRTVENAERTNVRHAMRKQDLTRTVSDNSAIARKGPLHSTSLPEIGLNRVPKGSDPSGLVWQRSSSSGDGFRRRGSLSPAVERTMQGGQNVRQATPGSKDSSYGSLSPSTRSCENNVTVTMESSPYPFRKTLNNSFGAVHTRSENHKRGNNTTNAVGGDGISSEELARRLFDMDGYDRNEVAPMLSKNDDYTKDVAVLFMKRFDFRNKDLVQSLRMLLDKFNLSGETQERERILIPFSNRYHECNKPEYGSADAVHTLVCAIMLLNTDLHGEQTLGRRMKQADFVRNLADMCDGKDYPSTLLKNVFSSIKTNRLEFHTDDILPNHVNERVQTINANGKESKNANGVETTGSLALMGNQATSDEVVYKEGLLYRKLIEDIGGKKASAWKRSWQPFFGTLRGMIMFLHKPDESKNFNDTRFSLGAHHAFASPAFDYTKKSFVFRFITADWKVLLFQARNKADMLEWVEGLNLVAASFSSPPLPAPVGSCQRFQKPVLPFSRTRLTVTEQLASHEAKAQEMANVLIDHLNNQPQGVDKRNHEMIGWMEKRDFYEYEYKRYRSYTNILKSSKLQAQLRDRGPKSASSEIALKRNGLLSENMRRYSSLNDLLNAPEGEQANPNYRESYFMAIYKG